MPLPSCCKNRTSIWKTKRANLHDI